MIAGGAYQIKDGSGEGQKQHYTCQALGLPAEKPYPSYHWVGGHEHEKPSWQVHSQRVQRSAKS